MGIGKADSILIIDDDPIVRKLLGNIFSAKYRIVEAADGPEGLYKLLDHTDEICAVLLDVIIPGMSGIEVLRKIHAKGLLELFPVFLITSEFTDEVLQEAYTLGVMDVIAKPFLPYMVEKRVSSVIELFSARSKLASTVTNQETKIKLQEEKIADLSLGMIESLATVIEFRSVESGEHVRRIYNITKYLLEKTDVGAGFTKEQIDLIALASMMHDVGKISIPDAILNKPGRLTPEEYEIMKTHSAKGAEFLSAIPSFRALDSFQYAYDIARHHHERWDGKGYPDGLKGDAIPIYTQVVAIADVYDALLSRRVYKDPINAAQVLEMLSSGECGAFNPLLMDSFFSVERELRKFYKPAN